MQNDGIVIVSGLPRSGTSMMMRMLAAGGMPLLTDETRAADADNPQGYYEFEPVKRLEKDAGWVPLATGKAVKVVSFLLEHLPADYQYAVIFMRRAMTEVLASQRAMLTRRAAQGEIDAASVTPERLRAEDAQLAATYKRHLRHIHTWLETQPNVWTLFVEHQVTLQQPGQTADQVNRFLGGALDEAAMQAAVEPRLYRQRASAK